MSIEREGNGEKEGKREREKKIYRYKERKIERKIVMQIE